MMDPKQAAAGIRTLLYNHRLCLVTQKRKNGSLVKELQNPKLEPHQIVTVISVAPSTPISISKFDIADIQITMMD